MDVGPTSSCSFRCPLCGHRRKRLHRRRAAASTAPSGRDPDVWFCNRPDRAAAVRPGRAAANRPGRAAAASSSYHRRESAATGASTTGAGSCCASAGCTHNRKGDMDGDAGRRRNLRGGAGRRQLPRHGELQSAATGSDSVPVSDESGYDRNDSTGSRKLHMFAIGAGQVHAQRDLQPTTAPGDRVPIALGAHSS